MSFRRFGIVLIAVFVGASALWAVPWFFRAESLGGSGSNAAAAGEASRDAVNQVDDHKPSDEDEEQAENEQEAEGSPVHVARGEHGCAVLTVREETRRKAGLEAEALAAAEQRPAIKAYGRLEQDPSATFTVRAPLAGYLESTAQGNWPRLGDSLAPGAVLGTLRPRLTPVERCDLTTRLAQARSTVEEIRADLVAARSSYESKRQLNRVEKVVSSRALEEAEAKVKSGEAQLDGAVKVVQVLEQALTDGKEPSIGAALTLPIGGEVVELPVQAGESVEAGQVLLLVADFRRLIARVAVPAGEAFPAALTAARIVVAGWEDQPLAEDWLVPAPAVSPEMEGRSYLIGLTVPRGLSFRPGAAVTAYLETSAAPLQGVIVPRSAVVRYGGAAWVYVQVDEHSFRRVPINTNLPTAAGWFVSPALMPTDRIIVTGAGSLLSEEMRSQIEQEAESEE